MHITQDVDLPQALIDAQRNERLVIFVGAGISIPQPSGLPNFEKLAFQIADNAFHPEKDEPLDRFLGRLKDGGIQVHDRARKIIDNPASKPTSLHENILSLFPSDGKVHLVTTNFDRHFTTVTQKYFETSTEIYYAPALPLGREFDGIVYLHGSVEKYPERLVLTDSDFGKAYLTDGWARRFLQDMFMHYTVLFVGYSHNDPVMNYLSRGLPAKTKRFALTEPKMKDHWNRFGIEPIIYPIKSESDDHSALGDILTAWINLTQMGALDHEQRIRNIVVSPPPKELSDANYIESALKDISTVRFFIRHAKSLDWLWWMEGKPAFLELFRANEDISQISRELANWFASQFVRQYSNEALAVVQRRGLLLNPALWLAIAQELAFANSDPSLETLGRWVTVLLRSPRPAHSMNQLEYILLKCQLPENHGIALLLFIHLTKPYLNLRPSLRWFMNKEDEQKERVVSEIACLGDEFHLRDAWQKIFQPQLDCFACKLLPILTSHLIEAHQLLCAFGEADENWDSVSFHRRAIEPHEQNRLSHDLDLVIDATRDVLEWMLKHEPIRAVAVIEEWSKMPVPLLKRLSIHGITENQQMSSDEKITWILNDSWLYAPGMKHEIFRLLQKAYPNANQSIRKRLLEEIEERQSNEVADPHDSKTRHYEIYNLLYWLHRVAPHCLLAEQHFNSLQAKHPDFRPRVEYPDFDHTMSKVYTPSSPKTVEELLNENPADNQFALWLLSYQSQPFDEESRDALIFNLSSTVSQSFDWSWKLVGVLLQEEIWKEDIWMGILRGWENSRLQEEQWKNVFTLLDSLLYSQTQLHVLSNSIADLLKSGLSKKQNAIPPSCCALAEKVADRVWHFCQQQADLQEQTTEHWLTAAINHTAGKIVEYWLQVLSKRRAELGESWTGLPQEYQQRLGETISGTTYSCELGRVLVAGQIDFLFALDAKWTHQNVLPLLDWDIDQKRAQQAWHGYLTFGRLNGALLPELLPFYSRGFKELSSYLKSERDRFCEHLAGIAVYSSSNPMSDGWLWQFISEVELVDRVAWATHVYRQLDGLSEDAARDLWKRWLEMYWSKRIDGLPLPLMPEEIEKMIEWAAQLTVVFPQVVEKICNSPAPNLKHTFVYHDLIEKHTASYHPKVLAQLLQHLLKSAEEPFLHCHYIETLVDSLIGSGAPHSELTDICNDLARLGCRKANQLKQHLEENEFRAKTI